MLIGVVAMADGAHGVAVDDPDEPKAGEPAVDVCEDELLGGWRGAVNEGRGSAVNAAQGLAHDLLDVRTSSCV